MEFRTATDEQLTRMLGKVRALLDRANHPTTPEGEANTCRERAEALMFKYRIEESMLTQEQRASGSLTPQRHDIVICDYGNKYYEAYNYIAWWIVNHMSLPFVASWKRETSDDGLSRIALVYTVYGYKTDIMFCEMLITSASVTFSTRMEPRVDRSLSDAENVYNLRMAGIERGRIGAMMGWGEKSAQRVTNIFKRYCATHGIDGSAVLGKGNNMRDFRESFAQGFHQTLAARLRLMRAARGADERGTLVLKSRIDEVWEMFYTDHPDRRPCPDCEYEVSDYSGARLRTRLCAKHLAEYAAEKVACARCEASKSGFCREHRPVSTPTRGPKLNANGFRAGASAAERVDLTTGKPTTTRMSQSDSRDALEA